MKAYVITTGAIFGLIVVAHVWRALVVGARLATDPWFIALTVAAAGLSIWAWRLLKLMRPQDAPRPPRA